MQRLEKSPRRQYPCDRCGFYFRKITLKRQRGLLLCSPCYDTSLEVRHVTPKWRSARISNAPLDPVSSPTVFTITSDGVTSIGQSQSFLFEGQKRVFTMYVVGDGAVVVTNNPAIVAGADKDRLCLIGTSDADSIKFTSGTGINLSGDQEFILKDKYVIQFSYDGGAGVWRETSRSTT